MKKKNVLIAAFVLVLQITPILAQNQHGILFPNNTERNQKCNYFLKTFQQKPREVKFSVIKENNKLYFKVNNDKWFKQLFKNAGDGIAIDIVSKKRYNCELPSLERSQIRGLLLKPVFTKQLKRGLKKQKNNSFRVLVGEIPEEFSDPELEFNILFLNNNTLCQYYTIFDLESYPWELLDMGMYLDSLTYKSKRITSEKEQFVMKYKTLQFTIPFQKNKSTYSPEDVKPLYDSLRLTDYNIKKINIRAYSSIEGSLKRNIELQEKRGKSIAESLQSFQKPNIITEVVTSENWVEFLNDISNTKYKGLKTLSKKEIKSKLVGSMSKELELYLKNHRKAVITLELDKKDTYKTMSVDVLLTLFNKSVVENNIEKALKIQNSIFEKFKKKETSPDFLTKMMVPKQLKHVPILNKNSVFKYLINKRQLLIVTNELKQLEKLAPKDKKIKYNLVALKFEIWKYNAQKVNETGFENEIRGLKKHGISQVLINRMLVNYHIIKAEKSFRKRDYKNKDKSVNYIASHYKNFPFSNYDYLSLAQFLTYYGNMEQATTLLDKKVRSLQVDENLLFYYLNLTIVNKNLTQSPDYRTMMLNAINRNKKRFCKLFDPMLRGKGGVTFQLLEDDYLRKTYCENCSK